MCTTEHCVGASHRLYTNMNATADPCADFDEFACGRFQRNFRIPEDKGSYTGFSPLVDDIYVRGRALLEEEDKSGDWEVFRMTKKLFKSCMNLERLEELGVRPLLETLKGFGGWPVLEGDDWVGEGYQWWEQVYKLSDGGFGKNNIVYLSVGTDDKDSTKRSIFLDQPSLGLSREFLVKGEEEDYVQHYFTYMKSAAKLMGAPQTEKTEKELKDVLLFEIELAKASGTIMYMLLFLKQLRERQFFMCRCQGGSEKRNRALQSLHS